jgi:LmbE family N-acetylglucosaminyl deacetylase
MEHRLLCVLAHPDDESLGLGGLLARAAADGVSTYLITATSGEQGWPGAPNEHPGPQQLAQIREAELRAAAAILGIRGLTLLRYPDSGLAETPTTAVVARLTQAIREIRPQVVVTFGPDGATGHPDHIAICQLTTAAVLCAADAAMPEVEGLAPHQVAKLYYLAPTRAQLDRYDQVFGDSAMTVDGVKRRVPGWPDWAVSAQIDAAPYTQQVWQAISCHRSQLPLLDTLAALPQAAQAALWEHTTLYRVFSRVGVTQRYETDLFDGLHAPTTAHREASLHGASE